MHYIRKAFNIAAATMELCLGLYSGYMTWNSGDMWVLWLAATYVFFREFGESMDRM